MIFLYIFIFIICCVGIRYKKSGYYDSYIEKEQCNAIKGVFILFVFIRHIYQYILKSGYERSSWADWAGARVDGLMGQLIVVMFLFYSGYGVWESIKNKGEAYVNNMPRHRILNTLVNFDVAVLLYILVDLAMGCDISLSQSLLSLTGWESVGNSNWYIFCILLCYALVYITARIVRGGYSEMGGVIICISMVLIASLLLSFCKQGWWYNTMMAFAAGCVYSCYKKDIENVIQKKYFLCAVFLILLLGVFFLFNYDYRGIVYNARSLVFVAIIIVLTMKLKIGNEWLYWLGKNLFPLYIYQRIPMIVLYEYDGGVWVYNHIWLYISVCFFVTLAISYFYKYWQIKL